MPQAGEIDEQTRAAAARRYKRLRRLSLLSYLGGWGVGLFAFLLGPHVDARIRGLFALLIGVAIVACGLVFTASWFTLLKFRCPRCGKRFLLSWWNNLPTARCKHCELYLG